MYLYVEIVIENENKSLKQFYVKFNLTCQTLILAVSHLLMNNFLFYKLMILSSKFLPENFKS